MIRELQVRDKEVAGNTWQVLPAAACLVFSYTISKQQAALTRWNSTVKESFTAAHHNTSKVEFLQFCKVYTARTFW